MCWKSPRLSNLDERLGMKWQAGSRARCGVCVLGLASLGKELLQAIPCNGPWFPHPPEICNHCLFFFSILFFLFCIFVEKIPWFHLFQAVSLVEVFVCWAAHAYIFFLSKTLIILPSNLSLRHFFPYYSLSCWASYSFCICPSFQQADYNVWERELSIWLGAGPHLCFTAPDAGYSSTSQTGWEPSVYLSCCPPLGCELNSLLCSQGWCLACSSGSINVCYRSRWMNENERLNKRKEVQHKKQGL